MRELRYAQAALTRDYLRAGAGLLMSLLFLLLVRAGSVVSYLFLGFVATFGAFGLNICLKQLTVIALDESGVARRFTGPVGKVLGEQRIPFASIDQFRLRYFGRRRDRGRGIVELTIGGEGARFTADQALEDFDALVRGARGAAKAKGLTLDAVTEANLSALGFSWN